jgi:hypothetical protein
MAQKNVLITGASSGIGYELAKIFAQNQYNLVLVARNENKLNELKKELEEKYKNKVWVLGKDLSRPEAPKEVYDWTQSQNIEVHELVNNAGFGDFGKFHEAKWQKQQEMLQLNIHALVELTHLYLPEMVAKKYGRILNVASTAAFQPGPLMAVYYATKSFVLHFSEGIANELQGTGVTVTALCPGATESGFQAAAAMEESKLVKGKKLPTSYDVALYGYKEMQKGTVVAIHGMMNYLLANSVRFTPRALVRTIVRGMQEKSK